MSPLEDLYQEIILDHNKRPRNFGPLAGATHNADGRNPLCGDELHVSVRIVGDRIEDVRFQGQGCAISKASASLMTEALSGKRLADGRSIVVDVLAALGSAGEVSRFEKMGELAALSGVRKFPARIKCASLAWHAVQGALDGQSSISTEAIEESP